MASTSPIRSPTRSLWADLSDEADEEESCPVSAAWECMSNRTASSFEGDSRETLVPKQDEGAATTSSRAAAPASTANVQRGWVVDTHGNSANQAPQPKYAAGAYFIDRPEEVRPWASSSSYEATDSVLTGMGPLPSSSSASWSVSPCLYMDGPQPHTGGDAGLPSGSTSRPADAPRRLRLKNKKLSTPKNSDSGSSKETEGVNARKVSESSAAAEGTEDAQAMSSAAPGQASDSFSSSSSRPKGEGEWSVGSAKHDTGRCRRCLFFDSPVGCVKGVNCDFCHLPHFRSSCTRPSKAKRDRYARLFQEIAEKRAKQAAAAGITETEPTTETATASAAAAAAATSSTSPTPTPTPKATAAAAAASSSSQTASASSTR